MKQHPFRRPLLACTLCFPLLIAGCGLTGVGGPVTVSEEYKQGATKVKVGVAPNFTAKSEGYSLWFPTTPKVSTQEGSDPRVGKITMKVAAATSGSVAYVIVPVPVPEGKGGNDAGKFIDGVVEGYIESTQGKLIKATDLMLGEYAGREIEFTFGGTNPLAGSHGITRVYYNGLFSYQLSAIGAKSSLDAQKTQVYKYLDSFRILETKPAGQ